LEQLSAATQSTATSRSSSKASWRKFAAESASHTIKETTSSWSMMASSWENFEDSGFIRHHDDMQRAWDQGGFEDFLPEIDMVLERHLPALSDLIRSMLLTLKSKCYEEMGKFDLALDESDESSPR